MFLNLFSTEILLKGFDRETNLCDRLLSLVSDSAYQLQGKAFNHVPRFVCCFFRKITSLLFNTCRITKRPGSK